MLQRWLGVRWPFCRNLLKRIMQLNDLALHNLSWTSNISTSINPVLADAILSQNLTGQSLQVSMISSKAYGGGLVSLNQPVPMINGAPLPYLKMYWKINPSVEAAALARCYECDAKIIFPAAPNSSTQIQNEYDGSAQLNLAEGGMWQIDDATPTWVDTGYKPGPFPAGVWTPFTIVYKLDYTAKTLSVISIAQGNNAAYAIPATLQNIAAHNSNWAMYVNNIPEPLLKIQIQLDCNTTPGAFSAEYNLDVGWSDTL